MTPTEQSRIVTGEADAQGLDFLVAENVMPLGVARYLREAWEANEPLRDATTGDEFWNNRILRIEALERVDRLASFYMREKLDFAITRTRAFFGEEARLYPDTLSIVGWKPGLGMPVHADNANEDGTPHELAHRLYSGTFYLSDEYDGGDLYLPKQDILVRPKKGLFVALPAGLSHSHSVTPIRSGERVTLSLFLTEEKERAMADYKRWRRPPPN